MERINFNGKAARKVAGGLLLLATIMLTACNGASGDGAASAGTGTGQGGTNASGPVSISVGLNPNSSVSLGAQTTATATLLDSKKQPIADALVTFSTDSKQATMAPSSGKVLTNANGQAVISLTAASVDANGAGSLQVDAAGASGGSSFTVTGIANYTIGSTSISLEPITLGQTTIDAYATTAVKVKVLINGVASTTPQTVTFTSGCATSGKAKLDATALTIAGEASATYTDNGCTGSDTITASLNIGSTVPRSATLNINPRKSSSLKFVSTTPADGVITLKGFGSAARQETAQVVFQLVDANNNGIQGKAIDFSLDVGVGGVSLQSASSITDSTGKATAIVLAGTQPTPVRVTAKSDGLSSQSNGLSISTGFPDMDSLSLSADRRNINGWKYDGATATLTMRLADHFNNPIPDGTVINFITDGGRIGSNNTGQCQTKDSQCSIVLNSQNPRPVNGRVHIVAYAIGEESFVDKNNNIIADQDAELVDINGAPSDIGEAFIDVNENGKFDFGIDQLVDFNSNGKYDGLESKYIGPADKFVKSDGKFNGSLCLSSWSKCSSTKTLHVFAQDIFIFSSDTPLINTVNDASPFDLATMGPKEGILHNIVMKCGTAVAQTFWIREDNAQNAMPTGTVISYFTKDAGSIGDPEPALPSSTQSPGLKTSATIFSTVVKAPKCSDIKAPDTFVSGTWGISVAVPDHGGGSTKTTKVSANICVYALNPSDCN
ncbi:Ig-like domain-containing protein [Iodobacter sp. CM08]|uniref:Ig-like domain-containing protein n=1 Tax=Iodobacter sp. CM08 TaxID=3085902 RepID=UPI00298202BF|nr:Ig-like domain-containing protein [Iodobacter sp. CM08]MDW5417911.1 Ig-like domain-containing protein [Iodobacter sp. CM08]